MRAAKLKSWSKKYPGTTATIAWFAFVALGTVHMWAKPAYAHFSTCQTPFACSGGILDFATGAQVPLDHGGTAADLSATGGSGQFVKQESSGGAFSVEAIQEDELPSSINATKIGGGDVSTTEFDYLDGVTSGIQAQVDSKLSLSGGTMTGQIIADNLGVEFTESDTNPTCSSGNFNIFADLSENKLKKCENGTASDLDTSGSVSIVKYVQTTLMDLNGDSVFFNIASGMLCSTESDCKTPTQTATSISNLTARANKDIGGTNNTVEIACGSCTSTITTDCGAGDACVTIPSSSSDDPTSADSDSVTWSAGNCCVGEITASGDTNSGVIISAQWTEAGA